MGAAVSRGVLGCRLFYFKCVYVCCVRVYLGVEANVEDVEAYLNFDAIDIYFSPSVEEENNRHNIAYLLQTVSCEQVLLSLPAFSITPSHGGVDRGVVHLIFRSSSSRVLDITGLDTRHLRLRKRQTKVEVRWQTKVEAFNLGQFLRF